MGGYVVVAAIAIAGAVGNLTWQVLARGDLLNGG